MTRAIVVALAASLGLAAAGCGGSSHTASTSKRTLTDLHDIGQLKTAFNTASDDPRLVVLVSPT
jgi:hypothetical protein